MSKLRNSIICCSIISRFTCGHHRGLRAHCEPEPAPGLAAVRWRDQGGAGALEGEEHIQLHLPQHVRAVRCLQCHGCPVWFGPYDFRGKSRLCMDHEILVAARFSKDSFKKWHQYKCKTMWYHCTDMLCVHIYIYIYIFNEDQTMVTWHYIYIY